MESTTVDITSDVSGRDRHMSELDSHTLELRNNAHIPLSLPHLRSCGEVSRTALRQCLPPASYETEHLQLLTCNNKPWVFKSRKAQGMQHNEPESLVELINHHSERG